MIHCYTQAAERVKTLVKSELKNFAGEMQPEKIVIKPNWVLHETDPQFPISALVTDARVIEATLLAVLELFPSASSIVVGDCPLQYADWNLILEQSGLHQVRERIESDFPGRVVFRDLRREVYERSDTSFLQPSQAEHGDPLGYVEINLGNKSHLEPISTQAERFAVNDYSSSVTSSNHRSGSHRYLVSKTLLDADLFINLPKWKSHQKSGITCALKNLVGINGDKAYLPHFRKGAPKWGGDEYQDENRWLYYWQTTLREKLQKKYPFIYRALKPGWELLKKIKGIETRCVDPRSEGKRFYVAGGAWFGNDTIWRMIYDLNFVIERFSAAGQQLASARNYFCIVDGLISGEGNGPLQPLPRQTDWLAFGDDPFALDVALAWFMGFDPAKIPLLANRHLYQGNWGKFQTESLNLSLDDQVVRLVESEINFRFCPAPGWRNHIER